MRWSIFDSTGRKVAEDYSEGMSPPRLPAGLVAREWTPPKEIGVFRKVWKSITFRDRKFKHRYMFNKSVTGWNVYGPGEKLSVLNRRYYRVHGWFKYKFFVPFMWVAVRILGKWLRDSVPEGKDLPQFRVWRVLERSFFDSRFVWYKNYVRNVTAELREGRITDDDLRVEMKYHASCKLMKEMWRVVMTVALADTAYLEFGNVFAHTLTRNMIKEFGKEGGSEKYHVLYTGKDMYNIHYLRAAQAVSKGKFKRMRMKSEELPVVQDGVSDKKEGKVLLSVGEGFVFKGDVWEVKSIKEVKDDFELSAECLEGVRKGEEEVFLFSELGSVVRISSETVRKARGTL